VSELPSYTSAAQTGDAGVALLAWTVNRELGWVVRPQPVNDFGVDAHIEIIRNGLATGRTIAAQVKAGASWFDEPTAGGWVFRGEDKHLSYWLQHSLPVIVAICDLRTETCYWREVRNDTVTRLKKGWKTVIPSGQKIDRGAAETLIEVAGRSNRPRLDLALRSFLMEKYSRRIALAPMTELPRDYHFFEELAEIDDDLVSITFVDLAADELTSSFFDQCRSWRESNARNACAVTKTFVYLISPDPATLPTAASAKAIAGSDIEIFRLMDGQYGLDEIDDEGWILMWFPSGGPDDEPMRAKRVRTD
jgi:Domain of unknown function (DUF4365)